MRLGYACINLSLSKKGITTNRTMRKTTFNLKGLNYVSEIVISNLTDLNEILIWNKENNFFVYRMSSDIFPWMSEYEFEDLPEFSKIKNLLLSAGDFAKQNNIRLSFHPGHFNVLGSPNDRLVNNTIRDLDQHARIFDLMGLDRSYQYPINIHCNGTYGDKLATLNRWCDNWKMLSDSAKSRVVIENDDKRSMYSVKDLELNIFQKIGVPITFDYNHHRIHPDGLSEREAALLAASTWPKDTIPLFHYASSKRDYEETTSKEQAHAYFIYEHINDYGIDVDIEVEAKGKELAVLKYYEKEKNGLLLTEYKNPHSVSE